MPDHCPGSGATCWTCSSAVWEAGALSPRMALSCQHSPGMAPAVPFPSDPNPSSRGQCLYPLLCIIPAVQTPTHPPHCHIQPPPLTHVAPLSPVSSLKPSSRPLAPVTDLLPEVRLAPTPQAAGEPGVCQDSTALGTVPRPQAEARILSGKDPGALSLGRCQMHPVPPSPAWLHILTQWHIPPGAAIQKPGRESQALSSHALPTGPP